MRRIEEELKIERNKQTLGDSYQHYLDKIDKENFSAHVGELQGKKVRKLHSNDAHLSALFNHLFNKTI